MAIFKCKMCGGTIEFTEGATVGVCDSCGTKQTLPRAGDDVTANLFNRANNLRLKCEFDKAAAIYEKIVEGDDSNAEAHWGIVLCKYGIEYVEDPKTHKRIPTCHRTLYEAVTADADYLAAVDYGDAAQQALYESEARAIDRIQKSILTIVKNEKPFDVFICYKETDENGKRTVDSAIANDIYYQLTQEGFKVFFAAITLEDKLGQEYEPYIFAALHSARVMLALGTKPEYFSSVWVKNEWSRFLSLMKTDRSKLLIPCYRDMDPYDLPEEFAHLQAQDMGKIGFINDLTRGIRKVCNATASEKAPVRETVVVGTAANTAPLLKRAFLFLEDGEWDRADEFCEQVLNQEPENGEAYLGKLMAELHVRRQEELENCENPFDDSNNYQKAIRFGEGKLPSVLVGYITTINERNANARLAGIYNRALDAMNAANGEKAFKTAAETFKAISGFKDADALAEQCLDRAEACRLDAERKKEEARISAEKAAKKRKKTAAIVIPAIVACIVFVIVLTAVIIPNGKHNAGTDAPDAETETPDAETDAPGGNEAVPSAPLSVNRPELPRVVDNADLLTGEEEADLAERIASLISELGFDIVILTNGNGYGGKNVVAFADDYYEEHGYGVGSDNSGILFLVDLAERDLYFSTCGKAITVFTDYGINQLYNAVVSYFSNGDYASGFRRFLRELPDYFSAYEQGAPFDLKV